MEREVERKICDDLQESEHLLQDQLRFDTQPVGSDMTVSQHRQASPACPSCNTGTSSMGLLRGKRLRTFIGRLQDEK